MIFLLTEHDYRSAMGRVMMVPLGFSRIDRDPGIP